MDQLQHQDEQDIKKRRRRIGIILIVIGLAGMILTALAGVR